MRKFRALLLACAVLVTTASAPVPVVRNGVEDIIYNPCAGLDPDGWLYWLLGCGKDSAGGGGGGAG